MYWYAWGPLASNGLMLLCILWGIAIIYLIWKNEITAVCECQSTDKCSSFYFWRSPLWCFRFCICSSFYGKFTFHNVIRYIEHLVYHNTCFCITDVSGCFIFCIFALCSKSFWSSGCLVGLDPFHGIANDGWFYKVKNTAESLSLSLSLPMHVYIVQQIACLL